ncbi:MAG: VOC family protein [Bacteroidia bacterium]|nr:VOC family protein [Bacteroidia bacterium]
MSDNLNPFGLHRVTPYLIVSGVSSLIPFLQNVFGAELRGEPKMRDDGSVMHAEVSIGDSVIMMGEPTEEIKAIPGSLYVYVPNCDQAYERALSEGGTSVMEPRDFPHGDRYGGMQDPSGNLWWIVTHKNK